MRGDVAKGADAEHAPHLDQIAVARDAPERRHCQGHAQEYQRPEAGAVDQVVERPRAVHDRVGVIERLGERQQQQRKRADPQGPTAGRACHAKAARMPSSPIPARPPAYGSTIHLESRHFFVLPGSHISYTAPHNFTYRVGKNVLTFFSCFDSSQPITRLGAISLASWNPTGGQYITGEGGAQRDAAPGGFDGGHPCRAFSCALCLLSF